MIKPERDAKPPPEVRWPKTSDHSTLLWKLNIESAEGPTAIRGIRTTGRFWPSKCDGRGKRGTLSNAAPKEIPRGADFSFPFS